MEILTNSGYQVLAIISDNNIVNKKMFDVICGGTITDYFINPFSETPQKVFVLFDTVHIYKSIRNNWFNQKDTLQTFVIPDIPNNMQEPVEFDDNLKITACVGK